MLEADVIKKTHKTCENLVDGTYMKILKTTVGFFPVTKKKSNKEDNYHHYPQKPIITNSEANKE